MIGASMKVEEVFALCHFLPAHRPVGTPRFAPPARRQGRKGAQISEQRENITAPQTRGEPGRAAGSQFQRGAVGRPPRSVAQPDRANQRPP